MESKLLLQWSPVIDDDIGLKPGTFSSANNKISNEMGSLSIKYFIYSKNHNFHSVFKIDIEKSIHMNTLKI